MEAINFLVAGGHHCTLLIKDANPQVTQTFKDKLVNYPYSKFIVRAWFRFVIKPESKQIVNVTRYFSNTDEISCQTNRKGFSEYFGSEDIETIKSYNLDFILRFGFGIIKGEILESAKYGIWSFHHDDDRKYRGVPTGFWEIWFSDPVNAAVLQRLTSQIDSGVILRKAYFATIDHSWQANLDNLLKSTTEWPLQVCRDIENGNTDFLSIKNESNTSIYKMPSNGKMLNFLLKVFLNKMKFHFRDLFLTEKWNIGIIPMSANKLVRQGEITLPEPIWLKLCDERPHYHADPFGFATTDEYHILCEDYNYKHPKGFIKSVQIDRQTLKVKDETIALQKDYHLAFPYLFKSEGVYYCIPENSEGKNVDLYQYDPQKGHLIFVQTLIAKLQAVDPVLFFYNTYWWLFFTDRQSTNERLHIWYSKSMLGPFSPHANNPVKADVRSSRSAGNTFVMEGKLMRPTQDCSVRSGRRICINEIITLTPKSFKEQVFTILNPNPLSEYSDGTHTFCVAGDSIIVDGKQEIFIWSAFTNKLMKKSMKIFARS